MRKQSSVAARLDLLMQAGITHIINLLERRMSSIIYNDNCFELRSAYTLSSIAKVWQF